MKWIKLHCEKWFWGSTRWELSEIERSVWIDCLARAGINDPAGQINFYNLQQIADQFKIPLNLLENTLKRFIELQKIQINGNIIKIINWEKYQSDAHFHKGNIINSQKMRKNNITNSHQSRLDKSRLDKKRKEKKKYTPARQEIVNYLNEKLNTHYKTNTKSTIILINAHLKQGFTIEDFKTVIDKKVTSWKNNPEMAIYLRPETLFGNKFESYLNEPIIPKAPWEE